MKKVFIFLTIIFVVLGCFTLGFLLLSPNDKDDIVATTQQSTTPVATAETVTTRDILAPKQPTIISDDELIAQIKNKRYIESSYMALEYSKISNTKLIDVIKNYIEDSNGMQPEDIKEIVSLHEKTFLNRYLKVYILTVDKTIDPTMSEVDAAMKNALFKMKSAYSSFGAYGRDNIVTAEDGTVTNNGPNWDINILKLSVQELEAANTYVDGVLKTVGLADIKIEKAWIDANINANDLTTVLNKSNVVETVDDLDNKPKKAYTDSGSTNVEEPIVVDDLEPTIQSNDADSPSEYVDDISSDIPYEEDTSLDLSDLQ